jgi:hypothetical protein
MRTHTGPWFIISSEGRESHQPQVFRASHTNSKILVPDGARTPNLLHWSRMRYHCATGSLYTITHIKVFENSCCLLSVFACCQSEILSIPHSYTWQTQEKCAQLTVPNSHSVLDQTRQEFGGDSSSGGRCVDFLDLSAHLVLWAGSHIDVVGVSVVIAEPRCLGVVRVDRVATESRSQGEGISGRVGGVGVVPLFQVPPLVVLTWDAAVVLAYKVWGRQKTP